MRKVGLHRLYKWRPSAKFTCLGVAVFCGILTACPVVALLEGQLWREPSTQTRMQVNADLRACTLDESELPNDGWRKKWPMAFPPYAKPVPNGMLGGIFTPFSHQGSSAGTPAFHEIQFYDRTHRAVYAYKIRRIGYTSRWHRTWEPLDLKEANLSANEYRAACSEFVPDSGPGRGDKLCEVKARYGRFVSIFGTYVSPWDMPVEEFMQVQQAIDDRMLQCAESFADKEWEEE